MFPEQAGATYRGKIVDFVLGEPLNVTDMDVGPLGSSSWACRGGITSKRARAQRAAVVFRAVLDKGSVSLANRTSRGRSRGSVLFLS